MITINHSDEGTTVEGTERGDGTAAILKAAGFRWGRSITAWYLPRAWHETTRQAAAERVARELGDRAELVTGEPVTVSAEGMPTYRERRLARAERLTGWAEKRQETATAALNSHPEIRHDWAFITQPGRIPFRERMNASDDRAYKSLRKAEDMASRAAGIQSAAAGAIYSDDPDAIEQLEKRIAEREAERERMKAANAKYRKEHAAELKAMTPYGRNHAVPYPSYCLTNLSGDIGRQKKRLAQLKAAATGEENPADLLRRIERNKVELGDWKRNLARYDNLNSGTVLSEADHRWIETARAAIADLVDKLLRDARVLATRQDQ